ncbi:DUF4382 domain-containing protein [Hydrogenobacter hydrogenophilus]|uniref:DUF4382 domain-containing protein n=1 Tax=Hydrogenobacter hydrogenophilus TaxID=35835 RepID=A0A285NPM9_9AQUI|nr:DUF4382 domain-containing protein [Hydrogenobacter hydrogenophilus]SNZ11484.1 hypothetical protein SAMN06265353_0250 [Hydrogenobacter hydrogenophilus]
MKSVWAGALVLGSLLVSCGGGGGGGVSSTSSIPVYFTDDMSVYPSILVKVYEVNLCSDNSCQQKVNLFTSQQGLQTNLAKLNGVLQYITTANIPQGTYNRLEVVMDKNLTITDSNNVAHQAVFTPMNEKPNKPNTVQCDTQRCYIRFNGIVQPFSMGKLVIDFVLKEFEVNTNTNPWQVYEVKMKPLTPQETAGKTIEIHLMVQSTSTQNNNFTGTWMGKTYTVNLTQTTACEINDVSYPASQCLNYIQPNMCVEVKVQEDPATATSLTAVKIETEDPNECIK